MKDLLYLENHKLQFIMPYHFSELFSKVPVPAPLNSRIYSANNEELTFIEPISKINIFVGPNNSGKSLVIREILKTPFPFCLNKEQEEYINNLIDNLRAEYKEIFTKYFVSTIGTQGSSQHKNIEHLDIHLTNIGGNTQDIKKLINQIKGVRSDLSKISIAGNHGSIRSLNHEEINLINGHINKMFTDFDNKFDEFLFQSYHLKDESNNLKDLENFTRIYLPTNRSLRVYDNGKFQFKNRTDSEYGFKDINKKVPSIKNIEIENGQDFFEVCHKMRNNSSGPERLKLKKFESFLSKEFFDSQYVELITDNETQVLNIKIGEEPAFPIHLLGDGLQMLLILTFPLFKYEKGIISIEEPETFIHPGLQKKLIKIYLEHEYAKNFLFFIATHSNHIIDSINESMKISIFSVKKIFITEIHKEEKIPDFTISNLGFGNQNALCSLGISNSSVYLSNCTIWIEGITDKLYLSSYIKCYLDSIANVSKYQICKNFQEGINYSFVFTGGDNIIHYDFTDEITLDQISHQVPVKFLCGKAMVIVDSDKGKNSPRKKMLEDKLGFRFFILPVIEIENLLPYEAIIKTIQSYPSCNKIIMDQLPKFEPKEYKDKRLGSFIEENILKQDKTKNRKKFSIKPNTTNKDNLTINDKVTFCQLSISHLNSGNLTDATKKVIESILDFIILNN